MKIYDSCKINGRKVAILVNDKEKVACEAVWNEEGYWDTDISYSTLGIDSGEIAENLDFEGARKAGYEFVI